MAKSVLIVDDDPLVLTHFGREVDRLGYTLAHTCTNGEDVLDWLDHGGAAQVGLIDIGLPGMDGAKLIKRLRKRIPQMRLLVLTVFDDTPTILRALRAGARGYLLKDASSQELEDALRTVWQGGAAVADQAAAKLVEFFNEEGLAEASSSSAEDLLTPREQEVLALLSRGLTYAEVASALDIGVGTVQTHVKSIYSKLGVTTKTEATAVALAKKLVKPWIK